MYAIVEEEGDEAETQRPSTQSVVRQNRPRQSSTIQNRPFGKRRNSFINEKQGLELLYSIIFPSKPLKDKELDLYVEGLLTKKLEALLNEPHALLDEYELVEERILAILIGSFAEILQGHELMLEMSGKIDEMNHNVELFEGNIGDFTEKFKNLNKKSAKLNQLRESADKIDKNLVNLDRLMKIPLIISQLLSNGYYDECIDLLFHVQKLHLKHPTSQFLGKLKLFSDFKLEQIKEILLKLLDTQNSLSVLLRLVALLRKLGCFSELKLRQIFLENRSRDLFPMLQNPGLEEIREKLFEIVTQYKAVFVDKSTTAASFVLGSFVSDFVKRLLNSLNSVQIDSMQALESCYTQLMFFGLSAGRLGLDFRHAFAEWTRIKILKVTQVLMDSIKDNLSQHVDSKGFFEKGAVAEMAESSFFGSTALVAAPMETCEFTALVVIVNSAFAVFNEIRVLPAIACRTEQLEMLHKTLDSISQILSSGTNGKLAGTFNAIIQPFLLTQFQKIFIK